ncbi:PIN domain-containing protein [Brevibacillus choshinensis]|uniref:PIN domain-containing protein n=1 Tax=Brevibacillus choshinensis TaxID=54911 RepID=UPI002E21494A|nr:PIN domain-containing protein [Brevibacillus choshinensis]
MVYLKTYIFFDTNILHRSKFGDFSNFAFPQIYDDIRGKIERYELEDRFEIYVPEISINELMQQQIEAFEEIFSTLQEKYEACKQLYGLELVIKEGFDYRTELDARKEQYLTHNRVMLLPICSESRFSSIVNRALNKNAPFAGTRGNSDKGFKDAVIWESLLEFAMENEGDYIFITHDKGFKAFLTSEFKSVTGQRIEIINRDEISIIDGKIEELSNERSIRSKWQAINNALLNEGLLDKLIKYIYKEELTHVDVNGLKCSVAEAYINGDIIDLNEVGTDSFRFKLNGHITADKFALPIIFEMDIIVVIDIQRLIVLSMELENIDGYLSSGDALLIKINKFKFNPYSSGNLDYLDDSGSNDFEAELTEEAESALAEVSMDKVPRTTIETKKTTSEETEIFQSFTSNYVEILSNARVNFSDESVFSLIEVLNKNATVDWVQFESKVSRMRLSIKSVLKSITTDKSSLEEVVEQIIQQATKDYILYVGGEQVLV